MALYPLLRPLVFALDAERAHRLTITGLKALPYRAAPFDPALAQKLFGLSFPSPVGLAAGFDKDAEVPDAMLSLGFGFVEVGTVTPLPQGGNPKPRLFRLAEDRAVINRLGFNNCGQAAALERLEKRPKHGIVGVNIGANKNAADRIADYATGIARMAEVSGYLTVNISSPNTPGLRALQVGGELAELLAAVRDARTLDGPPVFLKVAPDLEHGDHERIVRAAVDHGIDALIIANTTVSRPPLASRHGGQVGGLSGRPLKQLALEQLRLFRSVTGGELPLISTGGIEDADDAWARIRAGACLVQLYSALVYEGPGLARRIARGLADRVRSAGYSNIAEAVGTAP